MNDEEQAEFDKAVKALRKDFDAMIRRDAIEKGAVKTVVNSLTADPLFLGMIEDIVREVMRRTLKKSAFRSDKQAKNR